MSSRHEVLAAVTLALTTACSAAGPMRPKVRNNDPVATVPDLSGPAPCGAFDVDSLKTCVDGRLVGEHIRHLAGCPPAERRGVARAHCEQQLRHAGFHIKREPFPGGINVVGTKLGFSKPQQWVVLGAHYDAPTNCAGANDNASGVAAVLEAARVLSAGRFDRSLRVVCWDGGEQAQAGSSADAQAHAALRTDIRLLVSFEAVAFASDVPDSQTVPEGFEQLFPDQALAMLDNDHRADFLTVVAETATEPWANRVVFHGSPELPVHVLTLTARMKVKQREFHRSDHASFWDLGFPSMLITDTGPFRNPRIGCVKGEDSVDSLDMSFAAAVVRASVGSVAEALELR